MYQLEAYEMSYSKINGKEERYEKEIEVKDGKGRMRTVANGTERIKELSPSEIKKLVGFEPRCEGKLASGEQCQYKGHYLVPPARKKVAKGKKQDQKSGYSKRAKEKQAGGFYCGYHK